MKENDPRRYKYLVLGRDISYFVENTDYLQSAYYKNFQHIY